MFEHPPKTSGLDAVRGIMALAVCVSHGLILLAPDVPASVKDGSAVAARVAVLVFFVISGFVISLSIRRNTDRNDGFSPGAYASARAFRILPPLTVSYGIVVLASIGIATRAINLRSLLLCFATLGTRGNLSAGINDPLWTLQYEIQLYVIAGLVVSGLWRRRLWPFFVAIIYLGLGFRPWYAGHLTAQGAFYFAFLAGWLVDRREVVWRRPIAVALIVADAILFCSFPLSFSATRLSLDSLVVLAQMIFAAGCALLLPDVARWNTVLQHTGAYSYTLYIIHFPLFLLIGSQVGASTPIALGSIVAIWLLAAMIGPRIERPKEQKQALLAVVANVPWGRGPRLRGGSALATPSSSHVSDETPSSGSAPSPCLDRAHDPF